MIVVVDDDDSVLASVRDALESDGFVVHAASSATQALEVVAQSAPDLIISDIMMPEVGGFELQSIYQKRFPDRATPFLFLSSMSDPELIVRGLGAGADDYLVKPVPMQVVRARVRAVLRRVKRSAEPGFRGQLDKLPLPNLLRFCELKGLTGVVEVDDEPGVISLRFRGGVVDESDVERHLARLGELSTGRFTIRPGPLDFEEIRYSAAPPEPAEHVPVVGRLSGIRVQRRLFQIQTELAAGVEMCVVTVVTIDGKSVWKRTSRIPAGAETSGIQRAIDEQHAQIESEVQARFESGMKEHQAVDRRARYHQLFDEGYERYRAHDYEGAIALWQQAMSIDPESPTLAVNLRVAREKLAAHKG